MSLVSVPPRRTGALQVVAVLAAFLLAACQSPGSEESDGSGAVSSEGSSSADDGELLTLAFAGDVHFQQELAGLLDDSESTVGPMAEHLADADLAMVNLETAIAEGGSRTDKELEDPDARYWFRTPPAALELLDRSGVDVVTMANNHGADFGTEGLEETLAAVEESPVAVVGIGADADEAFAPHRVTVDGTDIAVLAADASPVESEDPFWSAGDDQAGLAAAREDPPERLVAAVEEADETDDLVVVYLHWGRANERCPTDEQQQLAQTLASAGADVVVGSHAHVLQGAGMLDDTYVAYGLGDFLWYHGSRPRTGVLNVFVADGRVVGHELVPARVPADGGQPEPVDGEEAVADASRWEQLRDCSGLDPVGGGELPAYEAEISEIDPDLRERMSSSHDEGRCPVDLADLRHLSLSYVGFDGLAHTGELVVHADHAEDVVSVFEELYDERWPIRGMRLVDEYDADDDLSMAMDNTSAYNCRQVAGQDTWSAHAYGAAIDLNPVENPYVVGGEVLPPAGQRFESVDRSGDSDAGSGVIREGDVVTRAFERIGWTWGGTFAEPDYQHFAADTP